MNVKNSAKSSNKVLVLGWTNKGKPADCGETMKNQLLIAKLRQMGVECTELDFKNWKRHPWVLLGILIEIFSNKDATLILSTSTQNIYQLLKLMKQLKWKQNLVHWVIGGTLGDRTQNGMYEPSIIGYPAHTLVESSRMAEKLGSCGVNNVTVVPNFKPISYYPELSDKRPKDGEKLKFVFLSRIMPEKGCDYILEAADQLNQSGYKDKYIIDFYGKISDEYKTTFERRIEENDNCFYKGFLNLCESAGYDILSGYHMMLFPTYWKGEGFAGVFIDAFVAGLPLIATQWAHNDCFLREGSTALFVPPHDVNALSCKMAECIDGRYDINEMSLNCRADAAKYDVDNVITEELLEKIGIIKR